MGKLKHRVLVFFVGIVICLMILEVSLRIVGTIYADLSESDKGLNGDGRDVILCIGDSVTFGIGASRDFSYPAQLQKMLNESNLEKNFTVINRGWPGQNSAQMLMRMERWLKEFRPDIVTILIGAQNMESYYGYQEYLQQSNNKKRGFFLSLHDSLDKIRMYKFFRLVFKQINYTANIPIRKHNNTAQAGDGKIEDNWAGEEYPNEVKTTWEIEPANEIEAEKVGECSAGNTYKQQGDYDKALEVMLDTDGERVVEIGCYNIIGSIYREKLQHDEAIKWFKKGIAKDPTQFKNYEGLGWSYYDLHQLEEAKSWFVKGFENAIYSTFYDHCYVGIGLCFEETQDFKGAIQFFEKETKRLPLVDDYLHTIAADYLLIFKNNGGEAEVHNWIEADIERILELCYQYNTKPILQNYPFVPSIEYIFRNAAKRHKITFVDQQSLFEKHIASDGARSLDYFVPDGHPNRQGYHLMAKNLWNVINEKVQ